MDHNLLIQLRETKVSDAPSAIMRAKLAIAVFGTATIGRQEATDYCLDMPKLAEEYGWDVKGITMNFSITVNKRGESSYEDIQFIPKPSKRKNATNET